MGGQERELAIYIGDFETQSQFYTMSGRWVHRQSKSVLFSVPHFVQPHELDELRPYLPASDVPGSMQDKLQRMSQLVPRSIGQSLIRKMLDFWAESDAVYQANSVRLDTAHAHVAYPGKFRYATLDEIASVLLPDIGGNAPAHKLPYPALYAVHRSLLIDGVGFKQPLKRPLRAGGHYEILSVKDMSNIELVRSIVREYMDSKFARNSAAAQNPPSRLQRFAAKARRRIDLSRQYRPFTHNGTVGPLSTKSDDVDHLRLGPLMQDFDATDMKIVQFLESWAALRSLKDFSPLNGVGSAILRAIERYGQDTSLTQATAWTFLQEIGAMAPWESRAAFDMRLPDTGLTLSTQPGSSHGFVSDKLKSVRRDWGDLSVYCIDDSDAHEIDDGISIEETDIPGQYWLHIHTADPGAHTDPTGAVAEYAKALVETVYMPDRVVTMLPSNFVRANLSLAPNRPCLTYSAKVNIGGEILDYKVTPGTVRNVRYVSPRVVEEAVFKTTFSKKINFHLVGPDIPLSTPRRMVEGHELSDLDKANFCLIHEIGKAHTTQRMARGAIYDHQKDFAVSVSFSSKYTAKKSTPANYDEDPSIQILTKVVDGPVPLSAAEEFFNVVQPPMLIAGEVAARWCKDRGIPVIHRVTPRNEDKADPAEFFVKHVLPTKNDQGAFDIAQRNAFFYHLGSVQPSAIPGPHISMGLEMFARCTSPLRRYPDLLLQWQIESAILEEARLGQSLVGNAKDDFLPFTRAQVDAFLPHVDARERLIAHGKRRARMHWLIHFLLRAWKYGEENIPRTFSFVVTAFDDRPNKNWIIGNVDHFQTRSFCECASWATLHEIKVGDVLEVELSDINVYHSALVYRPIRRLDASEKEALDRKNQETMRSQEIT